MTKRTVWNDGWEFTERPLGVAADTMFTEQGGWLTVDLPHDWLIYDAEDLYRDGEG